MNAFKFILISLITLSGCTKKAINEPAFMVTDTIRTTIKTTMPNDTLTYLALGDSYTVGQSVQQPQSFPYQLAAALPGFANHHVPQPTLIAATGWTTDNLIYAIGQSGLKSNFSFVTLLIGVNDQYQKLSQDNYKIKFAGVLNTAISFAGGDATRVFVLSIPDWGVTPFGGGRDNIIGPEIDQFNAINKSISTKAGVNYLDITAISRQAANDPSLVAVDDLHPSGKMYGLWVQNLEVMVAARFKK